MTDDEQKRIFSKNLRYYVAASGKKQTEICKEIGVNITTFNMWYQGNTLPHLGKLQILADYFKVPKSMLVEEHEQGSAESLLKKAMSTMDEEQLNRLLAYANFMMQYEDKKE